MKELRADFTDRAAALMQKADTGDAEAQYTFAFYLLKEEDMSVRKDLQPDEIERAMDYLKKSAAQGYMGGLSALDLGDLYYRGEIIPKNYKSAKLWFNTALLKKHPIASYMLGECAYYGYDEDVDYKKAVDLYLQATRGYSTALIRLGDMYLRGEYLPYDPKFAERLFTCVLKDEEKFFDQHELFTDAYDKVKASMDELESIKKSRQVEPVKETDEQAAVRNRLLEIVNKKNL